MPIRAFSCYKPCQARIVIGFTHIKKALENGKHVITTNKGPIALFYRELKAIADRKGVQLKFEGTVLSGTPAIQFALKELAGCEIIEIRGIVNGTTNYILTKMAEGIPYEEALKEAQKKGYAETNPSVKPELVDYNDPLYHVDGILNGLIFTTDHLGDVFIMGLGAGKIETGQAILHDLYSILEDLRK